MPYSDQIELVECPRDAMQGIQDFIPTEKKVAYLQELLKVGFDVLDAGSFVSPKAIPQMSDTHEVFSALNISGSQTKLLAIVANMRGAEEALKFEYVSFLGFPLSVSETFQQRNTNKSIAEALLVVRDMQHLLRGSSKRLVVYLSMGFGNPYGDPYSASMLADFCRKLSDLGVEIISLADTVGLATSVEVGLACKSLKLEFSHVKIGVHLHARKDGAVEKIRAAAEAGCLRFDGAIGGIGGCPMAGDDLVGNMPTEALISEFIERAQRLDVKAFNKAQVISQELFGRYH